MEAEHLISPAETGECVTLGGISTTVRRLEHEGSAGGVEGCQDDNEDAEGD